MFNSDAIRQLHLADPGLAAEVKIALSQKIVSVSDQDLATLSEETIWALSLEISFGRSVGKGYADLVGETSSENFNRYRELIRYFGEKGPTLGRIMAEHLVPILKHGNHLFLNRFLQNLKIMQEKGTYTLKDPLDALSKLLNEKDLDSALAYVDLLGDTFSGDMSYVQCQNLAHSIPLAIRSFSLSRRVWQIKQLHRVIKADHRLFDPFLQGLEKGLYLLSQEALDSFVSAAIDKLGQNFKLAANFLSMESKLGIDTYADMQVAIPLSEVRHHLNRYLHARTGLAISVKSMSDLPDPIRKTDDREIFICSDGKFIYLPDEIGEFSTKADNANLYKCLTRLEAGLYEFGTFDFDLEKAAQKCQKVTGMNDQNLEIGANIHLQSSAFSGGEPSDLERFFLSFPIPELADDLFTVFEHGRIRQLLNRQYPGLIRQTMPVLQQKALSLLKKKESAGAVFLLYLKIGLDFSIVHNVDTDKKIAAFVKKIEKQFKKAMAADHSVETCAKLVYTAYPYVDMLLKGSERPEWSKERYKPMSTPFGRRLRPDLFFLSHRNIEQIASNLKVQLVNKGFKVYKSDIRRKLIANKGGVSHEDIISVILDHQANGLKDMRKHEPSIDLSWLDLSKLPGGSSFTPLVIDNSVGPVSWYKEWDSNLNDYLSAFVRVVDRAIPEVSGDFYIRTLKEHQRLVNRIRYAFELLKPEGLIRLRQWVEGDAFDYRALLDFAMDKKAGRIPSDRLYIKHIKQTRDVAVLLLVDLSRSTANPVYNSKMTILSVEKEAIVLFCEALQVVGDAFAIAGFSSTGRLGVDYLRIKDFDENLDDVVKRRINAMTSRRNTRMGAAIRHATTQLEKIPSKVRLLIILSDGFPNDADYKHRYAIEDTRKAIFEARSKNIYAHAITVHFAGDPKLDDLYGNVHHNVISDVRELPDKLLRIYGNLTRN